MSQRTALRHFAPIARPRPQISFHKPRIRSQTPRRSVWLPAPRHPSAKPGQNVQVVKFGSEPIYSKNRRRRLFLYAGAAYVTWEYIIPNFGDDEEEDEEDEEDEEGEEEDEDDEDEEEAEMGLFLPMTWPKKEERRYYRASDPEWKEFVKFSKENERHKEVQKRLVTAIRSEISRHPNVSRILGKVDLSKGRFWLEIIFPDGPPQEYTCKGIEITEDFIAWSEKTVTQKEYAQLYRTLVPTATIMASWASFKYHGTVQVNRVREWLGLQPWVDPEVAMIRAHLMQRAHSKGLGSGSKSSSMPTPPTTSSSSASSSSSQDISTEVSGPKLGSLVPRGEEKPVTFALFMHNLKKNSTSTPIEPPRGSVVVTGLIEVIGTRGRTTLDVSAAFDPPSDEYIIWSWKPRRIQPKSQRPRGGP